MAQTKVVIICSPNQRCHRAVIIPSDDSQIAKHTSNVLPGEVVLVALLSDYRLVGADVLVSRLFSLPPSNNRCVVVNSFGIVTSAVSIDPKIDKGDPTGMVYRDPLGLAKVGQSIIGLGLTQ